MNTIVYVFKGSHGEHVVADTEHIRWGGAFFK